jgi:hypothetical protein
MVGALLLLYCSENTGAWVYVKIFNLVGPYLEFQNLFGLVYSKFQVVLPSVRLRQGSFSYWNLLMGLLVVSWKVHRRGNRFFREGVKS